MIEQIQELVGPTGLAIWAGVATIYGGIMTIVAGTPTKEDDRFLNRYINIINKYIGWTGKQLPLVKPKVKKDTK